MLDCRAQPLTQLHRGVEQANLQSQGLVTHAQPGRGRRASLLRHSLNDSQHLSSHKHLFKQCSRALLHGLSGRGFRLMHVPYLYWQTSEQVRGGRRFEVCSWAFETPADQSRAITIRKRRFISELEYRKDSLQEYLRNRREHKRRISFKLIHCWNRFIFFFSRLLFRCMNLSDLESSKIYLQ